MKNERTKKEVDVVEYKPDENAVWRQQFEDEIQKLNDQKRELEERQNRVKEDLDLNDVEKQQNLEALNNAVKSLGIKISEIKSKHSKRQADEYKPFIEQNARQLHIAELRFRALSNAKVVESGIIDTDALEERREELDNIVRRYGHAVGAMEDKIKDNNIKASRERLAFRYGVSGSGSWIDIMRVKKDLMMRDDEDVWKDIRRFNEIESNCNDEMSKMEEERALLEYDLHKTPKDDVEKRSDIMGKIEELEERYADVAGRQSEARLQSEMQYYHGLRLHYRLRACNKQIMKYEEAEAMRNNIFGDTFRGASMNSVARGMREYVSQAISGIGAKLETIKDSLKDLVDKVKDVISK